MYLQIPILLLCSMGLVVAAFFFVRGARVPGVVILLPVGLPVVVGVGGTLIGNSRMLAALAAVSPDMKGLILLAGLSESLISTAFGLIVAAHLAFLAGLLAFFAHAALVPSRFRTDATAPSTTGVALACGGVGLAALGASIALRFVLKAGIGGLDVLAFAALVVAAVCAALSAPALKSLPQLSAEEAQGLLWRRAALVAAGFGAGLALLGCAAWLSARIDILQVGHRIDPSMRAVLLSKLSQELAPRATLALADAALGVGVLLVPLGLAGPSLARGAQSLGASFAISVVGALAVAALVVTPVHQANKLLTLAGAEAQRFTSVPGLQLPTVKEPRASLGGGPALFVVSKERVLFDDSGGQQPPVPFRPELLDAPGEADLKYRHPPVLTVAASSSLPFADLAAVLDKAASHGHQEFALVVGPEHQLEPPALPELAVVAGADYSAIRFQYESKIGPPPTGGASLERPTQRLAALVDGERFRIFFAEGGGGVLALDLASKAAGEGAEALNNIRETFPEVHEEVIAPGPTDEVARVMVVIDLLAGPAPRSGDFHAPRPLGVTLSADRGALEQIAARLSAPQPALSAATRPTASLPAESDAIIGDGTLSKDVIRQVIRRNIGQIRYCYESELAKEPNLAGKVMAKFTIDARGNVASATTSGLENRELQDCITVRLKSWKFPEPKGGGTVTVNYPFVFKQAE